MDIRDNEIDEILNEVTNETLHLTSSTNNTNNSENSSNEDNTTVATGAVSFEYQEIEDPPIPEENINEIVETSNENTETTTATERIPSNSPTLFIDETSTRFSGTEWYYKIQRQSVIIAGVGGIGSNLAFQIARLHPFKILLYDSDVVEKVNMAGQLYAYTDVGKFKVTSVQEMLSLYCPGVSIYTIAENFTRLCTPGYIMMCGFDNMKARKMYFSSWKSLVDTLEPRKKANCLFIDGRLSIDTLQVFCIRGDDEYNISRYSREYLFEDNEAEETLCSMKQTTYLACMIASIMTNLFTNFTANLLNPVIPYDLPFFTEYDSQNMIFKTEN